MSFLDDTLSLAVPLQMERLKNETPETLGELVRIAAPVVGSRGDSLQYSSAQPGFTALVTGLAAGALLHKDGITYKKMHWCHRQHRNCPNKEATA